MLRINNIGDEIRRTPLVATTTDYGATSRPPMVLTTPGQHTYEPEPGGYAVPGLTSKKFLPDGRLVDVSALGASGGEGVTLANPLVWGLGLGIVAVTVGMFMITRR